MCDSEAGIFRYFLGSPPRPAFGKEEAGQGKLEAVGSSLCLGLSKTSRHNQSGVETANGEGTFFSSIGGLLVLV